MQVKTDYFTSSSMLLSKRLSFLIFAISVSKLEPSCNVLLNCILESKQDSEQCVAVQSSIGLPQFSQVSVIRFRVLLMLKYLAVFIQRASL